MVSESVHLFQSLPWFAWIAIVAIISGCLTDVMKRRYRHMERIEMIRQGMNPDSNKPQGVEECG